jgi:cell division protein FtsW
MIYSASVYSAEVRFNDGLFYVKKQAIALVIGFVGLIFGSKLKLELLKKLHVPIYVFSMVLLLMLFIPGVGISSYGATRWLSLAFMTFQPSELAKFGLVIFLATHMSEYPPVNLKRTIIPLLSGLSMCVVVMMEPNMSITMCIFLSMLIMLFVGGVRKTHATVFVLGGISLIPILVIAEPYRVRRIFAFLNPWASPLDEGYQLIQSLYALGSGGLFGIGLFSSRQKHLFLSFAESDFIFAIIGEELGIVGAALVIVVFLILIVSGYAVAIRSNDRFRSLLAIGISTVIAVQALINFAVVTGSMPPTGLPLPYISAGGSSLIVFMLASGILINISRSNTLDQHKEKVLRFENIKKSRV